jgi:acetyl-CoA carboxylase biotin carboxyl carrier protein
MNGNRPHRRKEDPLSEESGSSANMISIEQLQRLVRLLDRSDVSEVELNRAEEGTRLVLRKIRASVSSDPEGMVSVATSANTNATPPAETRHNVVAPLVGIFHSGAKPRGGALVAVGDHVKAGQLVATIESLNVINEVEAPVAGHVVELLVQEGQPVEYGQLLMTIETAEGA